MTPREKLIEVMTEAYVTSRYGKRAWRIYRKINKDSMLLNFRAAFAALEVHGAERLPPLPEFGP